MYQTRNAPIVLIYLEHRDPKCDKLFSWTCTSKCFIQDGTVLSLTSPTNCDKNALTIAEEVGKFLIKSCIYTSCCFLFCQNLPM